MPRYRLLEVVSGLGMGGAEKALLSRMKFANDQFEHTILNLRPEIDYLETSTAIQHFKIKETGISRTLKMFEFVRNNSFDLIIVRTPFDAVRFGVLKFFFKDKLPKIVFEAHSTFVSKKLAINWILGFLLRRVSSQIFMTIAVSESVKSGKLCMGLQNIKVTYLGGELMPNLSLTNVSEKPKLLFVGRLVELKRPIWLLAIMKRLNSIMVLDDSALTIVGTGPLEKDVRDYIELNNLGKVVKYVGLQTDLSSFYSAASHLVSVSTNEGLPLTFFEAKLSGLCIVSTPSGGGSEIFSEEDLELKTFEADEFVIAIMKILENPAPTLEMRQRIQEKSRWMSVDRCAADYYALLTSLLVG